RRSRDECAKENSGGIVSGDHAVALPWRWIDSGVRSARRISGVAAIAGAVGFVEADRSVVKSAAIRGREPDGTARRSVAAPIGVAYLAGVSRIQHRRGKLAGARPDSESRIADDSQHLDDEPGFADELAACGYRSG